MKKPRRIKHTPAFRARVLELYKAGVSAAGIVERWNREKQQREARTTLARVQDVIMEANRERQ